MSLEVRYIDVPQGAQETAQVAGEGQSFSIPQSVAVGAEDAPYATLEPFSWSLDGSRELLPEAAKSFWWSAELSDSEGVFENPPVLTFSFLTPYTATGLTFTFWPSMNQWCNAVSVSWYNGQTLLAEETVYPDSPQWTLKRAVEGFDSIHISLLSTNTPFSFAKVQQIQIGQVIWFGKEEITSVGLLNEADPTLCALSVDTMTVEIRDRAGRELLPQENQRMELYRDKSLLAVQYITESRREAQRSYVFSCQSAIGLLDDSFLGGVYNEEPVENLLADVLEGFAFVLDPRLAEQMITGYLPICTRREALQQIAFAIGALVTTSGGDAICLQPLPEGISGTFDSGKIFAGAKIESTPRLAKVEVAAHSYAPSAEVETLVDNEELRGENLLLTFDVPHYDYAVQGGTITASGANFVTITAAGVVTLTAKPYIHTRVMYTRRNAKATAAERNNVLTVEEATLIHSGNAAEVLDRLYATANLRQKLTQEAVISGHRAGQKVSSVSPWGTQLRGYISAMDSTLTQTGHTASVTILGAEAEPQGVYLYSGEICAGNKEVLY